MKTIGVGVIGSGGIAQAAHMPGYKALESEGVRIVAVADAVAATAKAAAEKFAVPRQFTDYQKLLAMDEIDAVSVCTPNFLHKQPTVDALNAGKHVLVEKPMALDGDTADRMIAEAARNNRLLMTAQVLRFFPAYAKTAELVKSAQLGPVRSAIFRRRCAAPAWSKWLSNPAVSGGGVFDLLIHDVDYCVHLFGAPPAVSATGYEDMPRGIDCIVAQFHYPGLDVVVTGGWHHPKAYPFSMEFTVVSDGGTLEFNSAGRPLTLYQADGTEAPVALADTDGFQAELEYFVACASSGRKPERCPPEDSATAVRLTRAMLESRSRNGERIACSL